MLFVGPKVKDRCVDSRKNFSEGKSLGFQMLRIRDYSQIYALLGIFETRLRIAIPSVLRVETVTQSSFRWYDTFALSPRGAEALAKAQGQAVKLRTTREYSEPEHFLHLSFWRYLIRRPYYSSLWVPTLHKGFSGFDNPKSLNTFKELDSRFGRALKVRNHVAHYSMGWQCDVDEEIRNLLWLIKALDPELVTGARALLADT